MVDGLAVDDGARAGGVVADHAAEVGPAGGGDVGAELQAVRRQAPVELVENDAGLHADRAAGRVDVEDRVQVLAAIDDDAGADRLARQAGAAAAGDDRDVASRRRSARADDVLGGLRHDDAERLDLVDAGVGAVEPARRGVEADLAVRRACAGGRRGGPASRARKSSMGGFYGRQPYDKLGACRDPRPPPRRLPHRPRRPAGRAHGADGHWVGELSTSALVHRHGRRPPWPRRRRPAPTPASTR